MRRESKAAITNPQSVAWHGLRFAALWAAFLVSGFADGSLTSG